MPSDLRWTGRIACDLDEAIGLKLKRHFPSNLGFNVGLALFNPGGILSAFPSSWTSNRRGSLGVEDSMKFKVKGADSKSGKDRILEIEARTESDAILVAKSQGVFPFHVSAIATVAATPRAADKEPSHQDGIKTYRKSMDQVFAAAQKSVRDLGYKVDSLDKANGLLNFKTGMSWKSWAGQEMSIMIIDNGDGTVEVSVTGRRNQSGVVLQVYDWGEASGIASTVFDRIDEYF